MRILLALVAAVLVACQTQPPIALSARESRAGQGIVIELTNTSEEFLHEIVVTIESPEGEVKKHFFSTLDPGATDTIGWLKLEGWPIPEGSAVTVSCKGFLRPFGPWKAAVTSRT